MKDHLSLPMFDLLISLTNIADLINPSVNQHHKRVAYIVTRLAEKYGLPMSDVQDITIAASLHDIGAFSMHERLQLLDFEPQMDIDQHGEAGYKLLRDFPPLARPAEIVRYHHTRYDECTTDLQPLIHSHILHLSDRVDVLIPAQQRILSQTESICEQIAGQSGKMFHPQVIEAFIDLAHDDSFWLELEHGQIETTLKKELELDMLQLDAANATELAHLFQRIIDFRSPFTFNHSNGVAACARQIAALAGYTALEQAAFEIAGYLHDLGKVAIPQEIIEKNGRLTNQEMRVIRAHPVYANWILEPIQSLNEMRDWAIFHHEKLDGSGYPYRLTAKDLSAESRVMSVADIFVALTEDRPYRLGMNKAETSSILQRQALDGKLDAHLISTTLQHFDDVNDARIAAQHRILYQYEAFKNSLPVAL